MSIKDPSTWPVWLRFALPILAFILASTLVRPIVELVMPSPGTASYIVEIKGLHAEGVDPAQALAFCSEGDIRGGTCEPIQPMSCDDISCRYLAEGLTLERLELNTTLSTGQSWVADGTCAMGQTCTLRARHEGGSDLEVWIGRWDQRS